MDQALPALLQQAYGEGRRVVVRAPSEEMVDALNDRLWTYDDASFLPHGAAGDGDPMSQPVSLTAKVENPNGASMLVLVAGAETSPDDTAFDWVVRLFDGRDKEATAEARREWRRLKNEGRTLSYWREGEVGWERAG
jgi:DNA polymerase III subunit chi